MAEEKQTEQEQGKETTGKEVSMGKGQVNYRELPSLALAYIGDAVYELRVREYLVGQGMAKVNQLHRSATKFVSAPNQARLLRSLLDELTEVEQEVVMRGRNTKSHTMAKNASVADYRYSTAFECLVAYLYLTDQDERLDWLFDRAIASAKEEKN